MDIGTLLREAEKVVRDAGEIAKHGFGDSPVLREKADSDIVTEGDLQVHRYVSSRLQELYPGHALLSEEAGAQGQDAEYVWILDPIDGTKYYARGVPLYSISLALERRGETILGVVFNPQSDQMYRAAKGQGATLDNRPIQCSSVTRLEVAMLSVEIPGRCWSLTLSRLRSSDRTDWKLNFELGI